MGMWGLIKNKDETETQITTKEVLIAKVDALFDQGDYKSVHNLLSKYEVIEFFKLPLNINSNCYTVNCLFYRIVRMLTFCGVYVEPFIKCLKWPVMSKHEN